MKVIFRTNKFELTSAKFPNSLCVQMAQRVCIALNTTI